MYFSTEKVICRFFPFNRLIFYKTRQKSTALLVEQ